MTSTSKPSRVKVQKGDILASTLPFAYALCSEERSKRCEHCFRLLSILTERIPCADCGYVNYCSADCQDESLKSGFHRVECHLTAQRPIRNLTRLIARVLIRLYSVSTWPTLQFVTIDNSAAIYPIESRKNEHRSDQHPKVTDPNIQNPKEERKEIHLDHRIQPKKREQNDIFEYFHGHKRDWNCLMDHYEDVTHDPDAMHTFQLVYEELELMFGGEYRLLRLTTVEQLVRVYGKILVNSFAVQEENNSLRQIGRAIYLGPSIMDHSCSPDILFTFDGIRLYLMAMRDLDVDDIRSVYICYIDELETFQERQRHLRTGYYFDCACQRCCSDSKGFMQLPGLVEISSLNSNGTSQPENNQLRMITEQIDNLYSSYPTQSEMITIAQRYNSMTGSRRLSLPGDMLNELISGNNLASGLDQKPIDQRLRRGPVESEIYKIIYECIERLGLVPKSQMGHSDTTKQPMKIPSIQHVPIYDFVACYLQDPIQLEQLASLYRTYYGDLHPRLQCKLWYFVAVLLQHLITFPNYCRPTVRSMTEQLRTTVQVVANLYREAKQIRQFIQQRIQQHRQLELDEMKCVI